MAGRLQRMARPRAPEEGPAKPPKPRPPLR